MPSKLMDQNGAKKKKKKYPNLKKLMDRESWYFF